MISLRLVIERMVPLPFIIKEGLFVPDIKRIWLHQQRSERPKNEPQFAPLPEVIRAINFVVINTDQCGRDRILLYGALQEALETKDQVIIPLCHFNEERLVSHGRMA